MEPFSTAAVYVTITKDMTPEKKRRIIARSMEISFLVLAFFALTGHLFFQVFNITIAAFQIAGAIFLVTIALQMLCPRKNGSFASSEDIFMM
jgi:multiple antibiotic resistance protein